MDDSWNNAKAILRLSLVFKSVEVEYQFKEHHKTRRLIMFMKKYLLLHFI